MKWTLSHYKLKKLFSNGSYYIPMQICTGGSCKRLTQPMLITSSSANLLTQRFVLCRSKVLKIIEQFLSRRRS